MRFTDIKLAIRKLFNPIEPVSDLKKLRAQPKYTPAIIMPKTDRQRAIEEKERKARELGLDGLPVEDVL